LLVLGVAMIGTILEPRLPALPLQAEPIQHVPKLLRREPAAATKGGEPRAIDSQGNGGTHRPMGRFMTGPRVQT
jgi:hypothetical protein